MKRGKSPRQVIFRLLILTAALVAIANSESLAQSLIGESSGGSAVQRDGTGNHPPQGLKIALVQSLERQTTYHSTVSQESKYDRFSILFILPIVLPLLPPMLVASSLQQASRWYPTLVALWVLSMVASLIEIAVGGERTLAGSLLAVPPITVPFFFLLPLCQTFLEGVSAGREALQPSSETRAWTAFRRLLIPRCLLWSALWVSYLVLLEFVMGYRFSGGNWVGSAICANLALGMFATCFISVRHCTTLSGMTMVTAISASAAVLLCTAVPVGLIATFGDAGYMGLAFLLAPLISIGLATVLAAVAVHRATKQGEAWFR